MRSRTTPSERLFSLALIALGSSCQSPSQADATYESDAVDSGPTSLALAFASNPNEAVAGQRLEPQPVVRLDQGAGSKEVTGRIRLTLAAGGPGLLGTVEQALVQGVATFTDISCTKSGAHTLVATLLVGEGTSAAEMASQTSSTIAILPAAAVDLGVPLVPASGFAGRLLRPAPSWPTLDAYGNAATLSAGQSVSLSLEDDASALRGARSRDGGEGAVTFDDVDIDVPGVHRLVATLHLPDRAATSSAATATVISAADPVQVQVKASSDGPGLRDPGLDADASGTGLGTVSALDTTFALGSGAAAAGAVATAERAGLSLGTTPACNGAQTQCAALDLSWAPRASDLVGYWRMDGNGAVQDGDSVPAFVGPALVAHNANQSGLTYTTGHVQGGLQFDGVDDYLTLPAGLPAAGPMSLSAWVRADYDYGQLMSGPFDFGADTDNTIALSLHGLDWWFSARAGGVSATLCNTYTGVAANVWQHLTAVADGTTHTLYLNGVRLARQPSTTNAASFAIAHAFIGRGQDPAQRFFKGTLDEVALWQAALTEAEVVTLARRQMAPSGGVFTQSVAPSPTQKTSWRNLSWQTCAPAGKALGATADSAADYPELPAENLTTDLIGLWHLREGSLGQAPGGSDFVDSSGSNNHARAIGFVDDPDFRYHSGPSLVGPFGASIVLGATGSAYIATTAPLSLPPAELSLQAWFATSHDRGASLVGFVDTATGAPTDPNLRSDRQIYMTEPGNLVFAVVSGGAQKIIRSTKNYHDRRWHHALATLGPAGMALYVDGNLEASDATVTTADPYSGGWRLGNSGVEHTTWPDAPSQSKLLGNLAEVAIWGRALNAGEALAMYRRGSEQAELQLRACAQADCADNPPWQGPDGTALSGFDERANAIGGVVNPQAPSLALGPLAPAFALPLAANVQSRIFLRSDDIFGQCTVGGQPAPCQPVVRRVAVEGRAIPGPSTKLTLPVAAPPTILGQLTETLGPVGCPAGVGYTLSADGHTYWTYRNDTWLAAQDLATEGIEAAALTPAILREFGRKVGRGGEMLWVRAYLRSPDGVPCQLAAVGVGGWR